MATLSETQAPPSPAMVLDLGGRLGDSVVAALGLLAGGLLVLSGPGLYLDWQWIRQPASGTEFVVAGAATVLGLWFLWIAAAKACRLLSAAPDAVIDEEGMTLQRFMAPRPIAWADVTASRVKRVVGYRGHVFWVLELELAAPLRSFATAYLPSRRIRLVSRSAAPIKNAGRIVRRYRMAAGFKR